MHLQRAQITERDLLDTKNSIPVNTAGGLPDSALNTVYLLGPLRDAS